jgi:dolichol-phosphate mannosyltransferase
MNIVVVIPTYNEAENIGKMLDVLVHNEFPKVKDHKLSILVVDSNSPDGTGDIVKKKMKLYKQVHLLMTEKGGLGADYAKGMKYAMTTMHADALIEFDADFQHNPSDIPRLIAAYTAGGDYIIGSRYVPGGKIPAEWGMDRKLMSFFWKSVRSMGYVFPTYS